MGATMLGHFSMAYNLLRVPADHLVRNIQGVLHSLVSRAQDNEPGMRRAYLTVTSGVGLIAFPVFAFVGLTAEPLVGLLLGPRWNHAATVLAPLSLVMALHAVEAMAGPTLGGRGEPGVELRVKLVMLVVAIPVLLVCARWSLAAVGWALASVALMRWLWMSWAVMSRLAITRGDFLRAIGGPLILAATAAALPAAISAAFAAGATPPKAGWLLLACAVPTLAVILALAAALPHLVLGPYVLSLLSGYFEKRPGWAGHATLRRMASSAARASAEARWA
jgi:PST family polysaccharide transporter